MASYHIMTCANGTAFDYAATLAAARCRCVNRCA